MKWKNPFDLNADKDLSDLAWFKLIICIGVTSIVVSIGLIVSNNSISYGMTYQHFNGVFEVFKFPLQMLIGMTASIALLAALHKSEQTRKQIYLANVQNNFVNYYKHLEEFKKYVDHLEPEKITAGNSAENYTSNYRHLHSLFYERSADGDYSCSITLMGNKMLMELAGLSDTLKSISSSGVELYSDEKSQKLRELVAFINSRLCSVGNYLILPNNFNGLIKVDSSSSNTLSINNSNAMIESMITILFHFDFLSTFGRKHMSFIKSQINMKTGNRAELLQHMLIKQNLPDYILELTSSLIEFNNFTINLQKNFVAKNKY